NHEVATPDTLIANLLDGVCEAFCPSIRAGSHLAVSECRNNLVIGRCFPTLSHEEPPSRDPGPTRCGRQWDGNSHPDTSVNNRCISCSNALISASISASGRGGTYL